VVTGRSYLGGLDSETSIEHGYAAFSEQRLAGRLITDWNDGELEEFCRRYNAGWAVCWSAAANERFRRWPGAEAVVQLGGAGQGWLFRLPPGSFTLKGSGRLVSADCQRITLADVVPEDGQVVLSLHYLTGLQAFPSRIQIEREPDPRDPIPFIRLRVPGPVARVVLTWPGR